LINVQEATRIKENFLLLLERGRERERERERDATCSLSLVENSDRPMVTQVKELDTELNIEISIE